MLGAMEPDQQRQHHDPHDPEDRASARSSSAHPGTSEPVNSPESIPGAQVPAENPRLAEHGSWNRRPYSGYKVVFVPFAKSDPTGKPIDVLTGFLSGDEARGRPVAVAVDKRGGLLVTDDVGGKLWRVTAAGAK